MSLGGKHKAQGFFTLMTTICICYRAQAFSF
jgi:hypothetical protein